MTWCSFEFRVSVISSMVATTAGESESFEYSSVLQWHDVGTKLRKGGCEGRYRRGESVYLETTTSFTTIGRCGAGVVQVCFSRPLHVVRLINPRRNEYAGNAYLFMDT
jgi:hypothetical protein